MRRHRCSIESLVLSSTMNAQVVPTSIMTNMFRHANITKSRSRLQLLLTFLATAGITLLPKCPLCLLGIMSALGLGTLISVTWLRPLTVMLLGVALGSLALTAHRGLGYNQMLLGLVAGALVLVSKIFLDYPPATYGGLVLLLAAIVWRARRRDCSTLHDSDSVCKCRDHTRVEVTECQQEWSGPLPFAENSTGRGQDPKEVAGTTLTAVK